MADEPNETPGDGAAVPEEKKKKNPLVMIGIIAGVLVVLTGGSFVAITKLMPPQEKAAADSTATEKETDPLDGRVKLEVKDLIMNPADKGTPRFVKVSLVFEVKDQKTADALADHDYRVRDLLISLVSRRTAAELATPEVRDNLRAQVMEELNTSVAGGNILDVFFTDYIVQ